MFFVQMEAGLMEIVRSLNSSWIYDTYFSLYRAIHPGKSRGKSSDTILKGRQLDRLSTLTKMACHTINLVLKSVTLSNARTLLIQMVDHVQKRFNDYVNGASPLWSCKSCLDF